MSGLIGRASAKSTAVTPASALSVQTSVQGLCIPLIWGKVRISGNLIYYADFQAIPHNSSGGGKGGLIGGGSGGKGGGGVSYTYQVAVALGLCQGSVKGVDGLWVDKSYQPIAQQNFVAFTGGPTQQPWGYTQTLHADQALAYANLAYVAAGPMQLGSSTELPSLAFEVHAAISDAVSGVPDADPSAVITDFLSNAIYGVGFPASRIGDLSLYTAYCRATGMLISPQLDQLTIGQDFVGTILEATNSEAVWSQGQVRVVPRGDQAIVAGTMVQTTEQHTIPTGGVVIVEAPGTFVADGGVVDPSTGKPYVKVAGNPAVGQYATPSVGQYAFNAALAGHLVSITYTWTEAASYTPPAAPFYAFTDDDYVVAGSNIGQPVQISRSAPQDAKNSVVVNFIDRGNQYNPTSTPAAKDDAAIQAYGLRQDAIRDYPFFKYAQAAQQSAQLALGRNAVRNRYTWTVGQRYKLLDPMDLVSLTDSATGIVAQWVRILEITENADLTLTMLGEDYLSGTAAAPLYGSEASAGHVANYEQDPGFVNAPLIFEPPATLTGGTTELWIAVSGASPVWGGCDTYVSYDDTNYTLVPDAHLVGPARHGFTATALSTDPAATLAVDISQVPGAQLTTVTATEAANFATLCWLDGELLAFTTATLTAVGRYTLGGLVRGCYGTPVNAHAAGLPFARLDASIIKVEYNKALIGGAIFLKFVSFNLWGRGGQSLAAVTEIEYTFGGGQPPGVITGIVATGVQSGTAMTIKASWNADALAATYQAGLSDDAGVTWRSVYDGSDLATRIDGLKATAPLLFRVRGITSSGIPGVWAQVTVPPSGITSQGSGYVDYLSYKDISQAVTDPALARDQQTDLAELAQFATSVQQQSTTAAAMAAANAAAAAVVQLSAGQLPAITATIAAQSTGLTQQVASINSQLMAQIAQEAADAAALGGRIDTLQQSFGSNSAFVTGISLAQATVNASNALQLDVVASQEATDNDSGELSDFVDAVQRGNLQALAANASNASQAAIVRQQIANTTAISAQTLYSITLATRVDNSFAAVSDSLTAQSTATQALAGRTTKVESAIGDPVKGLSATYTEATATTAVVNDPVRGNYALATRAASLEARAGQDEAAITQTQSVTTGQGQSIAALSMTVSANYQSQSAAIGSISQTNASQDKAIASLGTQITSNYTSQGALIQQNSSSITTLQQTSSQQGQTLSIVVSNQTSTFGGGNMIANSDFNPGFDGWAFANSLAGAAAGLNLGNPGDWSSASGFPGVLWAHYSGTPASGNVLQWTGPLVPVNAGSRYEVSFYAAYHRMQTCALYAIVCDQAGNSATNIGLQSGGTSQAVNGAAAGHGDPANFTQIGGFLIVPAGGVYLRILAIGITDGESEPYLFLTRPQIRVATPGQTILSPYSPGTQANVAQISASITSVSQTSATANAATASRVDTIQSQIGDPNTGLSATYSSAAATKAVVNDSNVGNQALSTYAQNLASTVSGNSSSISNLQGTVSNQGSTLASVQQNLSSVSNGLNSTNQNVASNSSSISTLSNQYGSLSTSVQQVSAQSAAGTANGQVNFSAQSAPSGVTARFAVTLNASGQQPASGGYALDLDGGKVMFTVLANAFRVEDPSLRAVPFGISNGTLYLQGVTNILSTIQSSTMIRSASTGAVVPVMAIDFQNGSIVISDAA